MMSVMCHVCASSLWWASLMECHSGVRHCARVWHHDLEGEMWRHGIS
jgi:hypothetical protein